MNSMIENLLGIVAVLLVAACVAAGFVKSSPTCTCDKCLCQCGCPCCAVDGCCQDKGACCDLCTCCENCGKSDCSCK